MIFTENKFLENLDHESIIDDFKRKLKRKWDWNNHKDTNLLVCSDTHNSHRDPRYWNYDPYYNFGKLINIIDNFIVINQFNYFS